MRCIDDWKNRGKNINDIRYGDDAVLIETLQAELQKLVTKIEEEMGIALHEDKTKCMLVVKEIVLHKCKILVSNKPITQTKSF